LFLPDTVESGRHAAEQAVALLRGATDRATAMDTFSWVIEKGYASDESFEDYRARKHSEQPAS